MDKGGLSYYKAIREVTRAVNSGLSLKEVLDSVIKVTTRAMRVNACSVVVLDSSKKKLMHVASRGLSERYLHKGLLDADKSLAEVLAGKPVAVLDARQDQRLQYPDLAADAGIASILGVPLAIKGDIVGTIRVYTREQRQFWDKDIEFLSAMADLSAIALENAELYESLKRGYEDRAAVPGLTSRLARSVSFAHPSEEEFARLLDFYQIEWIYEPRSFPLQWQGERVTEMFTPDFHLPGLDLYVELTTMKQSLVTEKNRKLRRLKELYPDVKIRLLYKKDYDRLLAKYGYGSLVKAKTQGIGRVLFSNAQIQRRVRELAKQISKDYADGHPLLIGILRGVFCFMADLIRNISLPVDIDFMAISYYTSDNSSPVKITKDLDRNIAGRDAVIIEDIVDTGMTLSYVLNYLKTRSPASLAVCTLLDKRVRRLVEIPLTYVGFEIPDEFVVGYGLDYQEEYRNLPFIAILEPGGGRKQS